MVDILLNAAGDLDLSGNTLKLTPTIEDNTRQRVLITLSTNRGEWEFNILFGVPYLSNANNPTQLLGKVPKSFLDAAITEAILSKEDITSLNSYSSVLDKVTGVLTIEANATTNTGEIVNISTSVVAG